MAIAAPPLPRPPRLPHRSPPTSPRALGPTRPRPRWGVPACRCGGMGPGGSSAGGGRRGSGALTCSGCLGLLGLSSPRPGGQGAASIGAEAGVGALGDEGLPTGFVLADLLDVHPHPPVRVRRPLGGDRHPRHPHQGARDRWRWSTRMGPACCVSDVPAVHSAGAGAGRRRAVSLASLACQGF